MNYGGQGLLKGAENGSKKGGVNASLEKHFFLARRGLHRQL